MKFIDYFERYLLDFPTRIKDKGYINNKDYVRQLKIVEPFRIYGVTGIKIDDYNNCIQLQNTLNKTVELHLEDAQSVETPAVWKMVRGTERKTTQDNELLCITNYLQSKEFSNEVIQRGILTLQDVTKLIAVELGYTVSIISN